MRRRDAAAVLTLFAVLLIGVQPAQADPVYPSQGDVKRAQKHAAAVGSRVAALQARLAKASARAQAAEIALSTAAEDFDEARIELQDSQRSATIAADVAARATQRVDVAQREVGRLAAQTYRSGGPLASLDVLLSPGGPDQVLERASMMHTLGEQRQRKVQKMDAARVVAATLDKQAAEAVDRQTAAAAKLKLARAAAAARASAARATLASEKAARTALLVKLAAAQRTTVAVQRARQAGLARAAAERRAAQQRRAAARAAARQQARPSGGSSSSPGPAPSGGGSSGGGSSSGSSSSGWSAVSWAKGRLGLPYAWGADGPGSYDCSGLVMRAWAQAGVPMPHSSRAMYGQVDKISYSQLRAGDLLFFATNPSNPGTIHHVAMYIGGGQMIEAPYTGANVRITSQRHDGEMPYAGRP